MDETRAHRSSSRGHEERDVSLRPILIAAGAAALGALLVHLLLWVYFQHLAARPVPASDELSPLAVKEPPPEPRLQEAPARDLEAVRAAEDSALGSYGWVDRSAGVVRIPIRRAMELVIQEGLPARQP